jgi:curved DNA-binding protein CbpA
VIDLYEVLQVDRAAEPEVIRAAYRILARKYHPDFGGDARLMASINEAWAVLGDPARRAAYDAEPQALDERSSDKAASQPSPVAPVPTAPGDGSGHGLAGRRQQQSAHLAGSVLDFGRYAGWTVGALVDHDPVYLEWLARTPIGRHLSGEIDTALARRAAPPAAGPDAPKRRKRAFR